MSFFVCDVLLVFVTFSVQGFIHQRILQWYGGMVLTKRYFLAFEVLFL